VAVVLEQPLQELPADPVVVRDQDGSRHCPTILALAPAPVNLYAAVP
jgi:hypothetical protein